MWCVWLFIRKYLRIEEYECMIVFIIFSRENVITMNPEYESPTKRAALLFSVYCFVDHFFPMSFFLPGTALPVHWFIVSDSPLCVFICSRTILCIINNFFPSAHQWCRTLTHYYQLQFHRLASRTICKNLFVKNNHLLYLWTNSVFVVLV